MLFLAADLAHTVNINAVNFPGLDLPHHFTVAGAHLTICCLHQAISSPFQMHYLNLLVLMVHQNYVIFGVLQYRLQNQCLLVLLFILQLIIGIVGLMFRYIQKMEPGIRFKLFYIVY